MIATTTSRNQYTGNSSTATYSFSFPTVSLTELAVYEINGATITTLQQGVDFTAAQNSDISTGGNITLTAGNLATGIILVIIRVEQNTQLFSFDNNGPFYPSDYESALDALCKEVQWLQLEVANCISTPLAESQNSLVFPSSASRAGKTMAFDSNGNVALGLTSLNIIQGIPFSALPAQVAFTLAWTTDGVFAFWNINDGQWEKVGVNLS